MGKNKEAGRSKTRPSSSSLAASLLPSGASTIGFGGYLGNSRVESTSTTEEASPFPSADGELTQHLKRLGRKDPTTKLKALTSLRTLFKEKSGEEIVHIIPHWAFEYKRLLNDYNREVRRATHETMTNLVITVGRGLAPHLKSLMGPWWFSQFDQVSEISQAARRSFEAAFPAQEKRLDALIICSNEVFIYLDENLKLTPQAMSDKPTPMDELEDMHQHVLSSSLLAIATLIDILVGTKTQIHNSEDVTRELKGASKARVAAISSAEKMFFAHKHFSEFLKSRNSRVRSATYSVLASFIKHIPQAFDEENIKTISASILGSFQEKDPSCHSYMWDMILLFSRRFPECWLNGNIQKNALGWLSHFLRNGCYGSQQISCPVLVLFLDSLPAKTVASEHFILNFLQSLWAGRNPSQSLSVDRQAFLKAFQECFLWSLYNASRYFPREDVAHFQVTLIDNILIKLLWGDYISLVTVNDQDGHNGLSHIKCSRSAEHDVRSHARLKEVNHMNYPISYVRDLGKCVIEILSSFSMKDSTFLSVFCSAFQKDCLEIFQQGECLPNFSENVEMIANFFLLLGQLAVGKDQMWPLHYLAGPLVKNCLPLIKSLDSPNAVKLLSVIVVMFGPTAVILSPFLLNEGHGGKEFTEDCMQESNTNCFLQVFKNDFIPWCLSGYSHSSSSKVDLLISLLLENEVFTEQWHSIILYATKQQECPGTDAICLLAILMENVRKRIENKNPSVDLNTQIGSKPEHWQHTLLDTAAVSVASASSSSMFHARFLRAVLGGSSEDDQICFLSKEVLVPVFEALLKNFATILATCSYRWVRVALSSLLSDGAVDLNQKHEFSTIKMVKMARFSLEVLDGSIFCLKKLDNDCKLLPHMLAAIFFMEWEGVMSAEATVDDSSESSGYLIDVSGSGPISRDVVGGDPQEKVNTRLCLWEISHTFRCKLSTQFWRSIPPANLLILRNILIQTARSAVFDMNAFTSSRIAAICCKWVLSVLELMCWNQTEEQIVLDQLLSENENWPLWVSPNFDKGTRSAALVSTATQNTRYHQFAAFVDKLFSNLGFSKVIAGILPQSLESCTTEGKLVESSPYSRSWLAAEVLCTWEWEGGSALESFLPLLKEHAKNASCHAKSLLFSIVNILLDGAIVHGTSNQLTFFNVWIASDDEVENIENPYLRALISLLSNLIVKDSIWRKGEATMLFEHVVDKLFIGTSINRSCLRVLPFVLNIISQPLLMRNADIDEAGNVPFDSSNEDSVYSSIVSWLQTALSLPPLLTFDQTGHEDFGEWIQVIISCYPLNAVGDIGSFRVAELGDISHLEKTLLLSLFRKQRCYDNASTITDKMSSSASVQMMLAKLMAVSVGFCWREFDDGDWDFVLVQLRRWMGSSVLVMEEIAEKIDDEVVNITNSVEGTMKKIEIVVKVVDPLPINISRTALIILSLFSKFSGHKQAEDNGILPSTILGKWTNHEDGIREDVFRLFFATGVAEAIGRSFKEEAALMIASSRHAHSNFWGLVASCVINSPDHVRNSAVQSMELWGLSMGPISSLYALLFSSKPISSLQLAAYNILSTKPVCQISLFKVDNCLDRNDVSNQDSSLEHDIETSSEEPINLRDEISFMIEKPDPCLLEMDLVANHRVNFFIGWALLLSYLRSLPPSSLKRERLIQLIQDSVSSKILDCIFQHIPLKPSFFHNLKKKDIELPAEVSKAANSAKLAITTCSLSFAVESLWPIGTEQMATLAGSIYGSMIHLLPAYVRNWFSSLRDRSLTSSIESFTKVWCSPPLIADEFSQIKEVVVADENFSVSVNKSAFEIVATYKKEETGMDLVIHLPSCYPLRPVDVDCSRSLGISEVKQRKWLLSMTAFVRNQNGAIAEAIHTWKRNFDKEFQGVEECPICYSILHTTNHSLPRLACKTCKHKFHSACLFKWFSTSNKSTCPLCQMPF